MRISLVALLVCHILRGTPAVWKYPGVFSMVSWPASTSGIWRRYQARPCTPGHPITCHVVTWSHVTWFHVTWSHVTWSHVTWSPGHPPSPAHLLPVQVVEVSFALCPADPAVHVGELQQRPGATLHHAAAYTLLH